VLAGTGVTNTGPSVVGLDVDTSPTPAIVGFPPGTTKGTKHAADAVAQKAQADLTTAYNVAKAVPSTNDVSGVDLSGKTLTPGVYTASSGMTLNGPGPLTLKGTADSVFIFQAGTTLGTGANTSVKLTGGVRACNVFWQVTAAATLGANSNFAGNILAQTSITVGNGATVVGRALARTGAVTLANDTFTNPCAPSGDGYWFVASDGGIFSFGSANFHGSTGGKVLNRPIVGMASKPTGDGYWLVASDGGIFSFGDAAFHGSTGSITLNQPIVGMTATPTGNGYWFVASDGGIFAFGDAKFFGSTGSIVLNKPIVGMASTPSGNGYWLVASDGGIFSFGDAKFFGSTGSITLNQPIVGMASTPSGNGYWFVAADGGIFAFGDARFFGSTGSITLNQPIVGMASTPSGNGYWFVAADGGIFSFGDAKFHGSTGSITLNQPIVGMASA
jgi:ribosomal protein L24E